MTVATEQIVSSSLWAAYGDALGFITELASSDEDVERRLGSKELSLAPWRRRVGGRFGVIADLPPGCYSDDTQLRLATSRALRRDGEFDVEVFAKIELPVWLSYALGAGRGSKDAAVALAKSNATWSTNFFSTARSHYVSGGGNGAAMRIQPHVWALGASAGERRLLADVIRNAICTHGHPRGLGGAVFHALALKRTIERGAALDPLELVELSDELIQIPEVIRHDFELSAVWASLWEAEFGTSLEKAFTVVASEAKGMAKLAFEHLNLEQRREIQYREYLSVAGGLDPATRGSGLLTAVSASVIAWLYRKEPARGLLVCAQTIGSDTDTIGTMAGALLGAITKETIPEPVQDMGYIASDARRLANIAHGGSQRNFSYPDLLHWSPPKTALDALGLVNDQMALSGLGEVEAIGSQSPIEARDTAWQWVETWFGQTILIKRRRHLRELDPRKVGPVGRLEREREPQVLIEHLRAVRESPSSKIHLAREGESSTLSVERAVVIARDRNFSPNVIGGLLTQLAHRQDGLEYAVAFAALVAAELRSR